jgi:hypothetical protein
MIRRIFNNPAERAAAEKERVVVIEEELSPEELAAFHAQGKRYARNVAWFQAHLDQIRAQQLGKHICVAGEELFVADTPQEVIALAQAAHPEDDGRMLLYLSPLKGPRIYAHQWAVVPVQ